MAFDKDCKTYWCDQCNEASGFFVEMVIGYGLCSDGMIVLVCPKSDCYFRREFGAMTPSGVVEELYDAKMCPKCPAEMVCLGEIGEPGETEWACSECDCKVSID